MKTEDPTLPGTHANDHEFVAQSQRVIDELLGQPHSTPSWNEEEAPDHHRGPGIQESLTAFKEAKK